MVNYSRVERQPQPGNTCVCLRNARCIIDGIATRHMKCRQHLRGKTEPSAHFIPFDNNSAQQPPLYVARDHVRKTTKSFP
eukprot:2657349-Rhodomonas_salina.3